MMDETCALSKEPAAEDGACAVITDRHTDAASASAPLSLLITDPRFERRDS